MADPVEKKPEPKEPTAEDVARARLEAPLTRTEKATFEARIAELIEENERLKAEIVALKEGQKPKPEKRNRLAIPTLFDD